MLRPFSARITIIILLIAIKILVADIEFVQTRNRKTIPVESLSGDQSSVLLVNRKAGNKLVTNANKRQVANERSVPDYSSKQEFTTDVNDRSRKGKFSFLLDSKENAKYNNKQRENNKNDEATQLHQSNSPDLITNTDIKVLQKFVKKLKGSAAVRKEGGQAFQISAHASSNLDSNIGVDNELGQTTNTHSIGNSNHLSNAQNMYSYNRRPYSSNLNRVPLNTQGDFSSKQKETSTLSTNRLSSMSKSDIDALLAVAKEWKRLHSDGKEKQQYDNKPRITNGKNNLQPPVSSQFKGYTHPTPNTERNQESISSKQEHKKAKGSFNTDNEGGKEMKSNPALKLPATSVSETKLTDKHTLLNDPGRQLKETVDKAIANTTQQLLQFIKLEKQLKRLQNISSYNESKNDNHYTSTFISLIHSMRNSKNVGGNRKETEVANKVNNNSRKNNEGKNLKNKQNSKISKSKSNNKLVSLEKQSSFHQTNSNKYRYKEKAPSFFNTKDRQKPVQNADKSKLKQRQRVKAQNRQKPKQQSEKQKHVAQIGLLSQKYRNKKERKKVKAQKQTKQKVKAKSHKLPNDSKQFEDHKQEEQKQEQEKQAQHQEQKQDTKQHQQQQQRQDQQQQQVAEEESENTEMNAKNEHNIQSDKQEEVKRPTFQPPKTSATEEQSDDKVLKEAIHFRIKTMKYLIASLAEDPFDTWIYHQKSFDELGITPSLLKLGIANLGSSKAMQHAVRKAVKGQNVKMLVVGGSISAGGGLWKDRGNIDGVYHKALAYWWKKTVTSVTKSEIEVNNVAIGGTDSEYFSYCINNFLESDPDIVLWELSANDYNRFNERNFDPSKPLEQLTRIILQLPSHPALIYVNFFRGDKQNFELGEKCPDSEETEVDVLSRYYDIPSLSWRRMVCNLITKRTFVSQELFGDDGYHPNLLGHAQVAMLLMMYIKGVFESVLAEDLDNMKKFNILDENDADFQNFFQLKIPAFKDPLNPRPSCWTLITPDYTRTFKNTLNEVNVLKGEGFELRNVTAWDVRTDRIQCLLATKTGAVLDLSLNVPVLDDDRNLQLSDAQTRTLAIAIHNKFGGAADVQLDELPSKTSVASAGTGKLKQTRVHIVSEDVRPGVHNLRFRSLQPGFCLTSIMVI